MKVLSHIFWNVIILPGTVLFCLVFWGCDGQNDSPVDLIEREDTSQMRNMREDMSSSPQSEESIGEVVPRIVAFGDSLTAGLGVPSNEAYPEQLARWLKKQGYHYEVINAGVSADTSAGGLRRVEWILKSHPTLVILELGANDGLRGQPLTETYKNLQAIMTRLKAEGVVVVLAGMRIPVNYGEDYTREFSEMYVRLAKEHDVALIPFLLEGVATHRHLNQGDGIHPTGEGYSIVVQNVWKALQPILTELADGEQNKIAPLQSRRRATKTTVDRIESYGSEIGMF